MKQLKYFLCFLLLSYNLPVHADNPCKKCDIETVKLINDNLNDLTLELVINFLCTFDSTCNNNIEYTQWSNETLFFLIQTNPNLFMDAFSIEKTNHSYIIQEIQNPVQDVINLQQTYDTIKEYKGNSKIKNQLLKALIIAAKKDNQNFKQ